jgi:hypothetical protein
MPCSIIAVTCSIIYVVARFLLKKYFDEHVVLSGEYLKHCGSKASGFKQTEINLKNAKSILWENESFTSGPGSRNSLYVVTDNSEKHTLVQNKIAGFLSIRKSTLKDLSETTGLPIRKEYYSLSSDLKNRRRIKHA